MAETNVSWYDSITWGGLTFNVWVNATSPIAISVTGPTFKFTNVGTVQAKATCSDSAFFPASISFSTEIFDASGTDRYDTSSFDTGAVYSNTYGTATANLYGASFNTSDYFNSRNSTTRTISFTRRIRSATVRNGTYSYGSISPPKTMSTYSVTLNAPPTFTAAATSTGPYYANVSTYKVNVSDLSAKYGGTISNVTLTIGNQTVSRTTNGELSIALDSAGTFTPTVTVTDSRGQTTTKQMPAITVNAYAAPTVLFSVERTQSNGKPDDESTTHATIVASFKFTNAVATLTAPTVTVNGTSVSPTWYSTRAADGTLSGSVTWSSVKNTDTVYGVISGTYAIGDSYTVGITPKDNKRTGGQVTALLPPAFFTIDFLAGGKGITFGQLATQVGFWCAMDMYLHGHKVPVFYESTSAPTASEGENGDVWIQYS